MILHSYTNKKLSTEVAIGPIVLKDGKMLDNPKDMAESLKVQYDKVFKTPLTPENADNQNVIQAYEAKGRNLFCDITFGKDEIT